MSRTLAFPGVHKVLISPFGFDIYSYGLALVGSFIAAIALATRMARARGESDDNFIAELTTMAIVVGLVGCRLGFVVQYPGHYLRHPLQILNFREGGMTILGGLVAAAVVLGLYFHKKKIPALNVLDLLAAPTLLGMAIGRIGCIMHGCCYGQVCDLPWGITYPEGALGSLVPGPRHPTQVYEMVLDLLLMGFIIWWWPRMKFAGQAFYTVLLGYGGIRMFSEFYRDDVTQMGALTLAQWVGLVFMVVGACGLAGLYGTPKIETAWQKPPDPEEDKKEKKSAKK